MAHASAAELRASYGIDFTRVADAASDAKLSRAVRDFVKDAADGGLYEVEAAQVGAERARDPAVKAFAEMLVTQHTAANTDLKGLAAAKNVELPNEPPMMKRRAVDSLRKAKDKTLIVNS